MKQIGFFSGEKVLNRLSKLGDSLEQLDTIMDWTIFLPIMDEIQPDKAREGVGGRHCSSLYRFNASSVQRMS